MKYRVALYVVVCAALALAVWWVANNTYWDEVSIPQPPSGEAATNPNYAAEKFSAALNAHAETRRTLGDQLPQKGILFLSYWNWTLFKERRERLEKWVNDGGRLIVDNTLSGDEDTFRNWTGLEVTHFDRSAKVDDDSDDSSDDNSDDSTDADQDSEEDSDAPNDTTDEPSPPNDANPDREDDQPTITAQRTPHIAPSGLAAAQKKKTQKKFRDSSICSKLVTKVESQNYPAQHEFDTCGMNYSSFITAARATVWSLKDEDGTQAARVTIGKGSVTLLNAKPFGNRLFTNDDHYQLFMAVAQLRKGDNIIFLSEEEYPSLLSLIWTYGKPAVLLLALLIATILWRGLVRFGPQIATPLPARRSLAEQIRGTGIFTLQFGGRKILHSSLRRAVHEAAVNRIPNYASLSDERRADALSKATGLDQEKLRRALMNAESDSKHALHNHIAILETVRRQLGARARQTQSASSETKS